jgi:hypothetical protein
MLCSHCHISPLVCLHCVVRDPSLRTDIATGTCLFRPLISFADDVPENTRDFSKLPQVDRMCALLINLSRTVVKVSPRKVSRARTRKFVHAPALQGSAPSARPSSQLSSRWQRRTTTDARSSSNFPPFARSAPRGPVHSPVEEKDPEQIASPDLLSECVSQRRDGRVKLTLF